MATLKAKTTIQCETCGCNMKRTKSFSVQSDVKANAIDEVRSLAATWKASLKGANCRVCQSIIDSI